MKNIVVLLICVGVLTSCSWFKSTRNDKIQEVEKEFAPPSPPTMVVSDDNHASFYGVHFWDNYQFADTTQLSKMVINDNIVHYIYVLGAISTTKATASINSTLDKAEVEPLTYMRFVDMFEEYLHDPNSIVRNEGIYIMVLDHILTSPAVADVEKARYKKQLEMAMKNRVGSKANNFTYTFANGSSGTLYNIKASYTLLFINNPGCNACREITEFLKGSERIANMVKNGKMKILYLYPDEDVDLWRENAPDVPKTWINGYDKLLSIRKQALYDITAIPTLYFLDADKKVLIKDFYNIRDLEQYLVHYAIK